MPRETSYTKAEAATKTKKTSHSMQNQYFYVLTWHYKKELHATDEDCFEATVGERCCPEFFH